MAEHNIFLPLEDLDILKNLRVKDKIKLSGEIYVFRDKVHKEISKGNLLPLQGINFVGSGVYYCAVTPPKEGFVIGSCGPTSSYRMDGYTEPVLKLGIKIMVGKGYRSNFVSVLCKQYYAVYLITYGGCGALLNRYILDAKMVAFPEFGPEAVYKFIVKDFPCVVGIDIYGETLWDKNFFVY